MDELRLSLELKSASESGEIEGWAATYNVIDSQNDRIVKGAFSEDSGKEFPLLWNHRPSDVAGVGIVEETDEGLRLKGRLLLDTTTGRETYSRIKAGAARGLSVGFRLVRHAYENSVRLVQAAKLVEISVTPFPANERALITAVKSEPSPYETLARVCRRPEWNLWGRP
jgi:hypothetical protein